jgi:hypothetical protein
MLARFRKLAQVHEKRATRTLDETERKMLFDLLQRVAQSLG